MSFINDLLDRIFPKRIEPVSGNQPGEGYPNTFQPPVDKNTPKFFDPALIHFSNAFRIGDPYLDDPKLHNRWIQTRRRVVHHILGLVNGSKWREHLVLRGSLVLKAWLGEKAREPGDIDWIFRPADVGIDDPAAIDLFEDLVKMVVHDPQAGEAVIDINGIATDDIWTYDRAPGKRVVIPWRVEGLLPGSIQVDVVFKEELLTKPVQVDIPTFGSESQLVWAADKDISLAWKLLWLENDIHRQGKDLYDAALLSEQVTVPRDLLVRVMESGENYRVLPKFDARSPLEWEFDEEEFKREYPWITEELTELKARLAESLKATCDEK